MLKISLIIRRDVKKPIQRKTTLKWSSDGELSSIDMARILQLLANEELTQCVLACDANQKSSDILFHENVR
tara:strand:+ start:442 stop:654 length:213 start_codon:yes stop_codon:yes gene_type:complete